MIHRPHPVIPESLAEHVGRMREGTWEEKLQCRKRARDCSMRCACAVGERGGALALLGGRVALVCGGTARVRNEGQHSALACCSAVAFLHVSCLVVVEFLTWNVVSDVDA